jgi:hypothetical protein
MSDTYRRYRAIKQAIMQFYQPRPTGHREKHLNTLVALICGLTGAKHAHLPTIADHAPSDGAKQESVIDRFRRWVVKKGYRHLIDDGDTCTWHYSLFQLGVGWKEHLASYTLAIPVLLHLYL